MTSCRREMLVSNSRPPTAISPKPNSICGIVTSSRISTALLRAETFNPGDYVQVGQGLMAIRSLTDVWVDANFKETQLGDLRIGQPVDL